MPNIMKIRQCFLELQLEMSGMFLRHMYNPTQLHSSTTFLQKKLSNLKQLLLLSSVNQQSMKIWTREAKPCSSKGMQKERR